MSPTLADTLRGAFRLGRPRPERESVARVKGWARAALGADEEVALTVNEIACLDPGCPGLETVILVMRPNERTRAAKVPKPLDEVTEADVRAALA